MIEWIKCDKTKEPTVGKNYLIFNGDIQVGYCEHLGPMKSGPIVWKSDGIVNFVTHYAEINWPE